MPIPNNIDEAFANLQRENPRINALVDVITNPNAGALFEAKLPVTARQYWTLAIN